MSSSRTVVGEIAAGAGRSASADGKFCTSDSSPTETPWTIASERSTRFTALHQPESRLTLGVALEQLLATKTKIQAPVSFRGQARHLCEAFGTVRRGELMNLQWQDVDFDRGVIRLEITKSGKRREIPFNGQLRLVLQARRQTSGNLHNHGRWNSFQAARSTARCQPMRVDEPCRFHDLRHPPRRPRKPPGRNL
jgi:hypothetical protein